MSNTGGKKEKVHNSCFILTINSNKTLDKMDIGKFDQLNKVIGRNPQLIFKYMDLDPNPVSKILYLESDYQIEEGEIFGRIHSHMMIRCHHTTRVQIDREKVVKLFRDNGFDIHFNFRYVDDGVNKVLSYIYKGNKDGKSNRYIVNIPSTK